MKRLDSRQAGGQSLSHDLFGNPDREGTAHMPAYSFPDAGTRTKSLGHLVSVVTAAHNAAAFIERAVRSVAGQKVPVLEHIVVDDGSTDETGSVLARLQQEFPHLVCLCQPHEGSGVARNRGIEYASGRYIAFLDSDDVWRPNKIEHQVGFMECNAAPFTYGDYEKREGSSDRVLARYQLPSSLGHEDLLNGCAIGCLTAAYNQETLGKRFMPDVRSGQDWGLWLALTRDGVRARKFPGNDAIYYDYPRSLSSNKLRKTVDVFRIYRNQERLGLFSSINHLRRHIVCAWRKP